MCQYLRKIKNPYYTTKTQPYVQEFGNLKRIERRFVSSHEYIKVPCGQCAECKRARINAYIQRAIIEAMFSHVFFITLTYNGESFEKRSITVNGETFHYAKYEDIQNMFKRFRDAKIIKDREFRYLCVNEYGDKKMRPHFHLLLFVSKREYDDQTTPFQLEKILYDNLGNFFAENVGTRKNPIYKKLFDFSTSITNGKKRSNYYVKYVRQEDVLTYVNYDFLPKTEDEKSIRYLLGYVNKLSDYEKKIECYINQKEEDIELQKKLKRVLRSQVRYSKGFGCGFSTVNGKRFYMDKISVRCSSNAHVYSEIVNELPDSYEEFCELYPSFNDEVLAWRKRDYYRHFSSWKRALNGMDADEYMLHCVYLKYFKDEFNNRYNRYKKDLQPKISNIFRIVHDNYMYQPSKVNTVEPEKSVLYNYLRGMVEESIEKGLPCISFRMVSTQSYMPMCKYYRQRVCTIDDTCRLYDKLGVKNFDEWVSKFESNLSNLAGEEQVSNEYKYWSDDYITDEEIRKNNYTGDNLYIDLFTR